MKQIILTDMQVVTYFHGLKWNRRMYQHYVTHLQVQSHHPTIHILLIKNTNCFIQSLCITTGPVYQYELYLKCTLIFRLFQTNTNLVITCQKTINFQYVR